MRYELLRLFRERSYGISELARHLRMSQATARRHVYLLFDAGVLLPRRIGRKRVWYLRREGFAWLRTTVTEFQHQLDLLPIPDSEDYVTVHRTVDEMWDERHPDGERPWRQAILSARNLERMRKNLGGGI